MISITKGGDDVQETESLVGPESSDLDSTGAGLCINDVVRSGCVSSVLMEVDCTLDKRG